MMVLTGMSASDISPLSDEFSRQFGTGAASTVFSTLQRLTHKGDFTEGEVGIQN